MNKRSVSGRAPNGSRVARVPSPRKATASRRSTRSRAAAQMSLNKYAGMEHAWINRENKVMYGLYTDMKDGPAQKFGELRGKKAAETWARARNALIALAARSGAKQSPRSGTERQRATKGSGRSAAKATPKKN